MDFWITLIGAAAIASVFAFASTGFHGRTR